MAKVKISRILPNTRIALFKGSGQMKDFKDEDILFHNTVESKLVCSYQKIFDLDPGEYCIRTVHKDLFFEHIDIKVKENGELEFSPNYMLSDGSAPSEGVILKNKVDPTAKSIVSYEGAVDGYKEFFEKADKIIKDKGLDLNEDSIDKNVQNEMIVLLNEIKIDHGF